MGWFWLSSSVVAVLAYWLYIHRQVAYNALILPPLPSEYFAGGASKCRVIRGLNTDKLKYCEDMATWVIRDTDGRQTQKIILSCDPGRYEWNTVMGPLLDPNPKGGLWILHDVDLENPYAEPLALENFPSSSDFHPLGIDLLQSESTSPSTLFVINHQRYQRSVEVFSLYNSPPRLVHVKQLSHSAFWAPNSVVALSPTELFVSIDHWFVRDGMWPWRMFMHEVESLLSLPLGRVYYVRLDGDDVQYTTPLKAISFPNGIALSKDKALLALASTTTGEVTLYNVGSKGALTLKDTIPTPLLPDNLSWQEDGSLLVAGHPHFRSIARFAKKKQLTAPTWLISIANRSSSAEDDRTLAVPYGAYNRAKIHPQYSITTVYQSNGTGWSAGTSATWTGRDRKRIVMTGLYSNGVLWC